MSRPYYIFSNGRIKRKENTAYIENENGDRKAIPVEDIDTIHLFGEVDLNTKLLNFLSQQNKTVHVYNYYGFYSGSFMPRDRNVSGELTVRQVEHYLDEEKRFYIAYSFVEGAIFHMLRNLYAGTRFTRIYEPRRYFTCSGISGNIRISKISMRKLRRS